MGDSYSASMLAELFIMFVFILMIFEHISKTSKRYSFSAHDTSKFMQKRELGKFASKAAFLWYAILFLLAFLFPFIWLLHWSLHEIGSFKFGFVQMKVNSLLIATGAAILITAIGFYYFYGETYLNIFLPSDEISLIKGGKALAFGYIRRHIFTPHLTK